ncbi:MAG TPA: hypothetical protein VF796_12550, partial [Humisphaera sp.]
MICLPTILAPLAHGGAPHGPDWQGPDWHGLASALRALGWDDPLVMIGLIAWAWLYAVGVRRIRRGPAGGAGLPGWQVACYWAGWAALAVALASPI